MAKERVNSNSVLYIFMAGVIFLSSCGRQIVPGLEKQKQGKEFDEAAYNYVFAEAVRQKLLGKDADAIECFQKSIELNPLSDAAYYQIAQIVFNDGDIENAVRHLKKAIEIQTDNYWYNLMLAGIYYQEQKRDSAILYYEKTVKLYPEKPNLQLVLANLYIENDQTERGIIILENMESKYGINEDTTVPLIESLIKRNEFDKALIKLEELLRTDPDNLTYNELLSGIYRKTGKNDEAVNIYNRLIERNPENKEILISLVYFLNEEKNFEEMFILTEKVILSNEITREDKIRLFGTLSENRDLIKNYSSRLELNLMLLEANYPGDDIISLIRPGLLVNSGKKEEAASLLEKVIEDRPANYFAWEKLLLVYYELRDFEKLMKWGQECATKFNRSFLAKLLYATAAVEKENYQTALEELRKAEILAGEEKTMKIQVLMMKADIYYRNKDYEKAYEAFEEGLKLDPNDITILNNYAYYLAEQNTRLKEAEKMVTKVIVKEPDNNTFLDTYAWVLYKRGRVKEAARIMEKIITSEEEEDAEWFEHYGYILKKIGRCREAGEKWRHAIELDGKKTYLLKEIENCKGK